MKKTLHNNIVYINKYYRIFIVNYYKLIKPATWLEFYISQHDMSPYKFAELCDLSHNAIYGYLRGKPINSMAAYKIQRSTNGQILYEFLTDKPKTKKVLTLEKVSGKKIYAILLKGTPIPELRQRVSFKQRRVYDSQANIKKYVSKEIKEQFNIEPYKNSVSLFCYFFMPIPISSSLKKKRECVNSLMLHTKKPDGDNLLKFVMDQMKGIVYLDDAQVHASEVKIESEVGYTIMIIRAKR